MTDNVQPLIEESAMNTPNIFNFATSELSQDAVVAYILSWADPECATQTKNYPKLSKLGRDLLNALLDKTKKSIREITKLCVYTQYNRIDIAVKINDSTFLIIEDKTNTGAHSDQIKTYKEQEEKNNKNMEILAVYLKTGNESKQSHSQHADGYFFRKDFIEVLKQNPDTGNDIVEEFRKHLEKWESDTESFRRLPFKEWGWRAHEGYYLALEQEWKPKSNSQPRVNWGYTSNPAGGSQIFWWDGIYKMDQCEIYMQIDNHAGLFIRACKGDGSKVSADFLWAVLEKAEKCAEDIAGIRVEKPNRYRTGYTAGAARIYFDGDQEDRCDGYYLAKNQEGIIDFDATVERLKKAEKLVEAMCQ